MWWLKSRCCRSSRGRTGTTRRRWMNGQAGSADRWPERRLGCLLAIVGSVSRVLAMSKRKRGGLSIAVGGSLMLLFAACASGASDADSVVAAAAVSSPTSLPTTAPLALPTPTPSPSPAPAFPTPLPATVPTVIPTALPAPTGIQDPAPTTAPTPAATAPAETATAQASPAPTAIAEATAAPLVVESPTPAPAPSPPPAPAPTSETAPTTAPTAESTVVVGTPTAVVVATGEPPLECYDRDVRVYRAFVDQVDSLSFEGGRVYCSGAGTNAVSAAASYRHSSGLVIQRNGDFIFNDAGTAYIPYSGTVHYCLNAQPASAPVRADTVPSLLVVIDQEAQRQVAQGAIPPRGFTGGGAQC